jgi:hypothetical protein
MSILDNCIYNILQYYYNTLDIDINNFNIKNKKNKNKNFIPIKLISIEER